VSAQDCIFCKIVRGEIPSRKVYEDGEVFAFHDIHPAAPVHFMIVPKQHIASLAEVDESHRAIMGKIMVLAPRKGKPPAKAAAKAGPSKAAVAAKAASAKAAAEAAAGIAKK